MTSEILAWLIFGLSMGAGIVILYGMDPLGVAAGAWSFDEADALHPLPEEE